MIHERLSFPQTRRANPPGACCRSLMKICRLTIRWTTNANGSLSIFSTCWRTRNNFSLPMPSSARSIFALIIRSLGMWLWKAGYRAASFALQRTRFAQYSDSRRKSRMQVWFTLMRTLDERLGFAAELRLVSRVRFDPRYFSVQTSGWRGVTGCVGIGVCRDPATSVRHGRRNGASASRNPSPDFCNGGEWQASLGPRAAMPP